VTTAYTTNLGLALPVQGELSGTWGDVVNDEITSLVDSAVAGTTAISTDADITLTDTDGVANEARQQILLWTAAGTVTRYITAPARTKTYTVINASSTQSIVLRGAGPTTGVIFAAGETAVAAWNGSDFVKIAGGGAEAGGVIQVNKDVATVSYTLPSGSNGFSVGPITIVDGVTITVTSGQQWVII
jgi:hypothetical protein